MEVNKFRVTTLDSWKTCAPVPFCRLTPPNNILFFVAGSGKSILWFVEHLSFSVSKKTESLVDFQLRNHPRYRSHVRRRSSLYGILLF
jgi:hypothetical protein